jgi:hypothetical protein
LISKSSSALIKELASTPERDAVVRECLIVLSASSDDPTAGPDSVVAYGSNERSNPDTVGTASEDGRMEGWYLFEIIQDQHYTCYSFAKVLACDPSR